MKITQVSPLVFSISIVLLNLPAYANPMGLNQSDMAFCSAVRDARTREAIANSQSSSNKSNNFGANASYAGIGGSVSYGSGSSNSNSSSSREMAMSQYGSKNCDELLRTSGKVTIAEINANAAQAIARMQNESYKYGADIQRDIAGINAAAIVGVAGINAKGNVDVANTNAKAGVNTALIQAGAGLLGSIIAPPSRSAEINAGVEKARIAADLEKAKMAAEIERQRIAAVNGDPGLALLQNWGLTITSCSSAVTAISIDGKQYCTMPNNQLNAGQYVYDRARNQLKAIRNVNYAPNPSPRSSSGFR